MCRILLECMNKKARLFNFGFNFRECNARSEASFQIPFPMTFYFSKNNILASPQPHHHTQFLEK